jgi:hypothetical protein
MKPASGYQGGSPSVFIGSYGYPDVRGGPLLVRESDNPEEWLSQGLSIDNIVRIRAGTIRGVSPVPRYTDSLQEIALSKRPVDVDVVFNRPVTFNLTFDGTVAPVGLTGPIRRLDVVGSAVTERAVSKITSDTDLTATDACAALMVSDISVYRIAALMTAGLLGRRRRFVPTKWAITAVDDTLSSRMKQDIARFSPADGILLFSGGLFGNRIACILVPGDWKYEMIEVWGRNTLWGGDREIIVQDREGIVKKGYSPISGAYYSARLAVCEYLTRKRRSARVILVRSISSDYWAPLGTWVVREAVRRAMADAPHSCRSLDEAVVYASGFLGFDRWVRHSTLLPELRTQRTLDQFCSGD